MSRSNSSPSGDRKVATATVMRLPRWTVRSASFRNRVNRVQRDQPRLAALGPDERGADQLAEERMGAVGPALELGVGLGADPEGVAGQLDELDQAVVG